MDARLRENIIDAIEDVVYEAVTDNYSKDELIDNVIKELGITGAIKEALRREKERYSEEKDDLREEIDDLKEAHGIDEDEFETGIAEIDDLENEWDLKAELENDAESLYREF